MRGWEAYRPSKRYEAACASRDISPEATPDMHERGTRAKSSYYYYFLLLRRFYEKTLHLAGRNRRPCPHHSRCWNNDVYGALRRSRQPVPNPYRAGGHYSHRNAHSINGPAE